MIRGEKVGKFLCTNSQYCLDEAHQSKNHVRFDQEVLVKNKEGHFVPNSTGGETVTIAELILEKNYKRDVILWQGSKENNSSRVNLNMLVSKTGKKKENDPTRQGWEAEEPVLKLITCNQHLGLTRKKIEWNSNRSG